jgi:hypothetical protein
MAKDASAKSKSEEIRAYMAENPDANPKEVVAGLKAKGVEVSEGLAKMVRYNRAKPAGKRGRKPKAGRKPGRPAASGGHGSKSQAVRDYLAAHPDAGPKTVVDALREQGVNISLALASAVKYSKAKRGGRRGRRRMVRISGGAAAAAPARTGGLTAADLFEVKRFVDQLGGMSKAKQAIETLEQLR